jgi:hypothetical protein
METRQQRLIEENEILRKEVTERFPREASSEAALDWNRSAVSWKRQPCPRFGSDYGRERNRQGTIRSCDSLHEYQSEQTICGSELCGATGATRRKRIVRYRKGSRYGVERRIGRIESANGGTLFLDEIGDLPLTAQAKLLRVLQEREVDWVGGRKPVPVDVRLVAATNKDLKEEIQRGHFRQDLFFRLNVVHIRMPALREIRGDIPMLAMHFLRKQGREMSRGYRRIRTRGHEGADGL